MKYDLKSETESSDDDSKFLPIKNKKIEEIKESGGDECGSGSEPEPESKPKPKPIKENVKSVQVKDKVVKPKEKLIKKKVINRLIIL